MRHRPATAAAFAVALLVAGQLLALKHEADARHVTCAEHGEQIEASRVGVGHDDGCGQSHLVAVDGGGATAHEDCPISRLLRTSTRASQTPMIHVATIVVARVEQQSPVSVTRTVDVMSIAPKTSPPV